MAFDNIASINTPIAAAGKHIADSHPFKLLLASLRSAKTITRHVEFYRWLQHDICNYISHDVLLVAWGNFEQGDLSYDVASAAPGINTRRVSSLAGLDVLVCDLYRRAQSHELGSYALQNLDDVGANREIESESRLLHFAGASMKSMLAYPIRDERDNQDSLYVFCSMENRIEIDPLTLDLLMPHVDSALRRVKCLAPEARVVQLRPSSIDLLSEREREVMKWVGTGKSNPEIGTILGISHNTVKNHLKRIFYKIGVTNRSQAVQVCTQSGATNV